MRKVYKVKRRSCALCKPNKTGHAPRFKERQLILLKMHDREMRSAAQKYA